MYQASGHSRSTYQRKGRPLAGYPDTEGKLTQDTWNPSHDIKEDVHQDLSAAAALGHDGDRREEDRDDVEDDVAALGGCAHQRSNFCGLRAVRTHAGHFRIYVLLQSNSCS